MTTSINEDVYPEVFVKGITAFVMMRNKARVLIASKGGILRDYLVKGSHSGDTKKILE